LPVPVSVPALVSIPVPISVLPVSIPERISAKALRDAGEEEVVWTGAVYSVSPPPSSVPMPSFVMARGRGATGKVADKACAEGSGVDASATNELRKLLKLQEKDNFF
jgi:Proline-rich nuclear receptor coactivator motif